ncbi:serine/threonine-protein phosphatase 7 long form-like protein [Gossypium australe]|uniref:Serine/threonine-protein phosphatase 7 long form-like protein n=1 Tax=Gossypium australe TaxID=47621 RepID=A0A5B6VQH4_9ROSI|nr:serine/threonine-protein phosphatase 7 long form-like protein [Gossypium australe]
MDGEIGQPHLPAIAIEQVRLLSVGYVDNYIFLQLVVSTFIKAADAVAAATDMLSWTYNVKSQATACSYNFALRFLFSFVGFIIIIIEMYSLRSSYAQLRILMAAFPLPDQATIVRQDQDQLQLGLPVDRSTVTGSIYAVDWRDVCEQLLGRVLEMIYGACIDMNWLRRNFGGLNEDSSEVQREQHVKAYILMIIGGLLIPDKSRNFVHLRWILKLVDFREACELSSRSIMLTTLYQEMC